MIIDNIKNIQNYVQIPKEIIDFINKLTIDIPNGKYIINSECYANIEEYKTKADSEGIFEAHNNYIDIQILLSGTERIYVTERTKLTAKTEYDENRDIEFFNEKLDNSDFVTLNGNNFVVLYPHEAQAPQISIDTPMEVKKVVVKLACK